MAYKDKDKQREANRQAQARFKAKLKGITEGITNPGITDRVLPENVPPHGLDIGFEKTVFVKPKRGKEKGRRDDKCVTSEGVTPEATKGVTVLGDEVEYPIPEDQRKPHINYGPHMTANELAAAGLKFNRVSKPGDDDYDGICTLTPNKMGLTRIDDRLYK